MQVQERQRASKGTGTYVKGGKRTCWPWARPNV